MRIMLASAVVALVPWLIAPLAFAMPATSRARVAVFFEPAFPSIDAPPPDPDALRAALDGFDVSVLDASGVRAALDARRVDVLVLPFGSAFPQSAWPSICGFLERGGSFVNLGGVPFAVPVIRGADGWRESARTTAYAKQLGIVQAFAVDARGLTFRAAGNPSAAGSLVRRAATEVADEERRPLEALAGGIRAHHVYELIVRLTDAKAFADEDGSDGPREARLVPLVHGFGAGPLPVAAPFVQIDRLEGRFAGGRWLLATGDSGVSPLAAARLVAMAASGPSELRVQPLYAGFHPGEPIAVSVTWQRVPSAADTAANVEVELSDGAGRLLTSVTTQLKEPAGRADARGVSPARETTSDSIETSIASAQVTLPIDSTKLGRGLYTVRARVAGADAPTGTNATSGFWIYDDAMLRGGRALAAGRDYFTRDGAPFPVAGTTYMASDVHRRFLLEPNPRAWNDDFEAMAAAGVNLVRTGIWTAWALHSERDGRPTEAMLRALEVFVLTARQHDIPVVFNLFAFVPPAWGAASPYFDADALGAQNRFAGGIALRLAPANDIAWDLINEPSFSSPQRLWQCRPNYDAAEQAAWEAWLRRDEVAADETTRDGLLSARWNAPLADGRALPALHDFGDRNLFGVSHPNKAFDYKRFAQDAFTAWTRGIVGAIRGNGNALQLITVGQDEGGAGERPSPLLFGRAVDFTGTHTWWNNDALLWDALMSKLPDRPSLVEETGLMTYERADGSAWRSEQEAQNLLERKMALAFAAGGAGFVQWLWNTNVYMPIDNEAGIGFLRADGTAKPEVEPFVRLARFVAANRSRFSDRAPEDVAIVVPQSNVLSVRDQGTAATQRAVRTLEYGLRVPVRMIDEYAPADLKQGARLLVLPSPRVLTSAAWEALMAAVEGGATLLVTGPAVRDEYERSVDWFARLGLHGVTRPVSPLNRLRVGRTEVAVPYRGAKLERVERGVVEGREPATVEMTRHGKGTILWCPLPVELSDDERATSVVYREALRVAGIRPAVTVSTATGQRLTAAGDGILVRPLRFRDATLLAVVNETDSEATLRVQVNGWPKAVPVRVAAERAAMILVDNRTGRIIGRS